MGRHEMENQPDTRLFGLIARRPENSGRHRTDTGAFTADTAPDLADVLRALPVDETAPMPEIPDPEPPDYSDPPSHARVWLLVATAVGVVLVLSVSCALYRPDGTAPSGFSRSHPAVSPYIAPEDDESSEHVTDEPEPARTALLPVPGPTVTVTVSPSGVQSAEESPRPVPTVTVTRTATAAPAPRVTVTETHTAFSKPVPRVTVTVTRFLTLPDVLPSP